MQDPRFSELEFLLALDRAGTQTIAVTQGTRMFGLEERPLKEMLLTLVEQDFVNGNATAAADTRHEKDRNLASDARLTDLNRCRLGEPVTYRLGHKGRVYFFDRREALRADEDFERQFRIVYDKAAWDRELDLQLLTVTESEPLSLIVGDLDGFKAANDRAGHPKADELLERYMRIARDAVERSGRAYRLGQGDELGAILPRSTPEDAKRVAEVMRARVEAECRTEDGEGRPLRVTASIGVATLVAPTDRIAAYAAAEGQMRRAKEGGKNRVSSCE